MINYPIGITKKCKTISYKNRGMNLESLINETNYYYLINNKAVIYKKPTPIKIIKMNPDKKRIINAVFDKHSTTDYNGVYKGYYIDFEAKSTKSKTSFNLNNLKSWQISHFRKILMQKAITFLIIEFSTLEQYYVLPAIFLLNFIDNTNKKSIPLKYIQENSYEIKRTINPPLDYLKSVDLFLKSKQ